MVFSEKITELRKRSGLSQEEFGEIIGVSRQAVSKWEMAQSIPDLNRIMAIAKHYGVTTDFLLKDKYSMSDLEKAQADSDEEGILDISEDEEQNTAEEAEPVKSSSGSGMIKLEEVESYLTVKKKTARNFCIAMVLFLFSPFAGIILYAVKGNDSLAFVGAIIQILFFFFF